MEVDFTVLFWAFLMVASILTIARVLWWVSGVLDRIRVLELTVGGREASLNESGKKWLEWKDKVDERTLIYGPGERVWEFGGWIDSRQKYRVSTVVGLILEHLKLDLDKIPATSSKAVLKKKPSKKAEQ